MLLFGPHAVSFSQLNMLRHIDYMRGRREEHLTCMDQGWNTCPVIFACSNTTQSFEKQSYLKEAIAKETSIQSAHMPVRVLGMCRKILEFASE